MSQQVVIGSRAPKAVGTGAATSSGGMSGAAIVATLAYVDGIGAVIYIASKRTTEQEASDAFPNARRGRDQFQTNVARDLYTRLRSHGLGADDAESATKGAMSRFGTDSRELQREGHSPESTAAYLFSLLVVEGDVEGDRREAARTIYAPRYEGGSRRG